MARRRYSESSKRIITLIIGLCELILETFVYGWFWFKRYYPELSSVQYKPGWLRTW